MPVSTLLFIVLSVLVSVALAYFQYFFKTKNNPKITILLFFLRALSLFLLGLLLINPKIKSTIHENVKPVLSFLVDNSRSTKHFKEEESVKQMLTTIKSNKELSEKFDMNFFALGQNISVLDSLHFEETNTDLSKAIKSVNALHKTENGAIVLISDGNQTIGNDYEFVNSKQKVFPVVIGDTTKFQDVKISQLNVNKYSYLENKFPVEVLLYYDGETPVESVFTITKNGKKVFSERVKFSKSQPTKTITTNLSSTSKGTQYYTAGIGKISNEKNTRNNYKSFAVEVIDEQTKVLLLSSILHPDLGAFKKAIESNKQRKVEIALASKFKKSLDAYQLVLFYQPNASFKKWMTTRTSNFILVTGTKTDWRFINSLPLGIQKDAINQSENYGALYNSDFTTFLQKNIYFDDFAPLQDRFGTLEITTDYETLLYQKLKGITTEEPLIATLEQGDSKFSAIFGEGIWKWRGASYREENTFEMFDAFIANLVQYTSSTKKRKRLEATIKNIYPANSTIDISALYLDKNYQFDTRANLQLSVTNVATKANKLFPFTLNGNAYKVSVEGLEPGDYRYTISALGNSISTSGKFKVTNFQVEEQFTNANADKLGRLAQKTEGTLYHKNQMEELLSELVAAKDYKTVQKSKVKEQNLIHWKWLLILAAFLLATEWFIRKYIGKI